MHLVGPQQYVEVRCSSPYQWSQLGGNMLPEVAGARAHRPYGDRNLANASRCCGLQ
jgi:hypothetical protein